jgi:heme A synthase
MDKMYTVLTSAHSGLRWIVILFLILAIIKSFSKEYSNANKKLNLFTMIFSHFQLLIGIILYFVSPKVQFNASTMSNSMLRFFTMEHAIMMLLYVVLITIGKKKADLNKSNKLTLIFFGIAFLVLMAGIPWPFRSELGGAWF